MEWTELLLPAGIGALTSLIVALITIRAQRGRDRAELEARLKTEREEWRRLFTEASRRGPMQTQLLAQQFRIGFVTITYPNPELRDQHFIPRNTSLTIGTSKASNIILHDDSGRVSRTHALIDAEEDAVYLMDLSTDGTTLNDRPVGRQRVKLASGDVVQFGNIRMEFRSIPPS